MASVVNSFAIFGIEGYIVKIETDTIYGKPSVNIVGLGDKAVKESRERLEAAITHAGFDFPKMKIVINLAPGDIKKSGSHFDLAMAAGLLTQSGQLVAEELDTFGFIAELSLNAELRPCSGVLPMVIAAKSNGIRNIIVAMDNLREASLVSGINIFGLNTLKEVVDFLQGVTGYEEAAKTMNQNCIVRTPMLDFQDVKGQDLMLQYIVAAAAGGHNILMTGAPGCGKSMIAKRIPGILPSMDEKEALEVTKIYSVAGLLKNKGNLITQRPFRSPHHNASMNSLVGGGNNAMPGEISLAHNGVLFLDEIAEFNRRTLDSMRQPLEDGKVTISRVKFTHSFPASFMLVAAMNPCSCGYYGNDRCKCTDYEVLKYRQKISGPVLDRLDIQKYVQPVNFIDISRNSKVTSSRELRQQVESARDIQKKRFEYIENVNCNAQMFPYLIEEHCKLDSEGLKLLRQAFERFNYSARSYHKFLKVARTFADLEHDINIGKSHILKALMCRDLDKEQSNMTAIG